jgi:protein-tyrosine phosphatase
LNARDLGGYPTGDGGWTRWGAVVRADNLCQLTGSGRAALVGYGVRTIVDLRFPQEVAATRHPFAEPADPDAPLYLNVPTSGGRDPALDEQVAAAFAAAQSIEEVYRIDLDANRVGFARFVRAAARAPEGVVVVHCHFGKDRTGLVSMFLLTLAGVSDDAIAAEYALTAERLAPAYERRLAETPPADRRRLQRLFRSDPEAMLATLRYLRDRHGGVEPYLLAGGATPSHFAAVRRRFRG